MNYDILSNMVITGVNCALSLYTEQYAHNKRMSRHCWAVILKYEGETIYTSNGSRHLSNIDNIVILPQGSRYEWECTKAGHFESIEFECDTRCDEIFSFPIKNGNKILKMMKEIEYKNDIRGFMHKPEIIRDLYSVIINVTKDISPKYAPADKLNKLSPALNYITANYTEKIKNDELARLTGLSTVYFRKLFTDVVGMPPISYISQLRIKKACEMLKSDYSSITDIALSLGYSSIYDFSRDFKKHTGIAPSKY